MTKNIQKILPLLTLIISVNSSISSSSSSENSTKCLKYLSAVLKRNSPELIGHNLENNHRVNFIFTWKHIDGLLNKKCVNFYLLQSTPAVYARSKRESVGTTTQISNPVSKDNTSGSINLESNHDCQVYDVQLAVAPLAPPDSQTPPLLLSKSIRFWPQASLNVALDLKGDSIKLHWPRKCHHVYNSAVRQNCDFLKSDRVNGVVKNLFCDECLALLSWVKKVFNHKRIINRF